MTTEQIIKSLEICANDGDCKDCAINPHRGNYGYCTSLAIKAALDLINRQKAEIERSRKLLRDVQNGATTRKRGEWLYCEGTATLNASWRCSVCRKHYWYHGVNQLNFCPECGSDMRTEVTNDL